MKHTTEDLILAALVRDLAWRQFKFLTEGMSEAERNAFKESNFPGIVSEVMQAIEETAAIIKARSRGASTP